MSARVANRLGRTLFALYFLALLGVIGAVACAHAGYRAELAAHAAFLFVGAMVGCGVTMCLISLFERHRG